MTNEHARYAIWSPLKRARTEVMAQENTKSTEPKTTPSRPPNPEELPSWRSMEWWLQLTTHTNMYHHRHLQVSGIWRVKFYLLEVLNFKQYISREFLTVLALSFHSVFEGLAIGLEASAPRVWILWAGNRVKWLNMVDWSGARTQNAKENKSIKLH